MAVRYSVDRGRFVVSAPRRWTTAQLGDTGVIANYDLRADGRSLAVLMPSEPGPVNATPFVLVTNFPDEIRRLLSESAAPGG